MRSILREENARLVMAEAEAMALVLNHEGAIERLTRERDDLQEHERQTHERLGAILGTNDSLEECAKRMLRERDEARAVFNAGHREDCGGEDPDAHMCACGWLQRKSAHDCILGLKRERDAWQDTARNEMAGRRGAEAEVARLEGLILETERHMEALLNTLGASKHYWIVKVHRAAKGAWDAYRIRAQREDGR